MLSKNLVVKRKGDSVLLYDSLAGGLSRVRLDVYQKLISPDGLATIAGRTRQTLESAGLLVSEQIHQEAKDQPAKTLLRVLRLNVTRACNLSCTYCYVDRSSGTGIMPLEIAARALDGFSAAAGRDSLSKCEIRFFGGEPLIGFDLIREVVARAPWCRRWVINTNGTLVDDTIARFLAQNGFSVLVSLDGCGEANDRQRLFSSGQGTFGRIVESLHALIGNHADVGVLTVVTERNMHDLPALIDFLKAEGVRSLGLGIERFGEPRFSAEIEATKARMILDAWEYGSEHGVKVGGFWRWVLTRLMKGGTRFCSGAGGEVSVSPEGDLNACHAQAEKIGDVCHFDKVTEDPTYLLGVRHVAGLIQDCRGCRIEGMCCGGCVANFEHGEKYKDDKWCYFHNAIVDQFLDRLCDDASLAGRLR